MSKLLLIQGDQSVQPHKLKNATGAKVVTCEGSYAAVSKADSHGTDFDAVVWSGHGGFDGPNYHKPQQDAPRSNVNQTAVYICQQDDSTWKISAREHSQPSAHETIHVTVMLASMGPFATDAQRSWIKDFEKKFNTQLDTNNKMTITASLFQIKEFFRQTDNDRVRFDLKELDLNDGADALDLSEVGPALKNATSKKNGFVYLGSCHSGSVASSRGVFRTAGDDPDYRFAQGLADEIDRLVIAAPMKTSEDATATNMSRLMNVSDSQKCNVKLQDRARCFTSSD